MSRLPGILAEVFGDSPIFFRDNVLGCGTLTTVCLSCSKVITTSRAAWNHECAAHIRDHHSPPPEPPTPDQRGGTPPAGADPSEDTPPNEACVSFGDSGGGELHDDTPIPFRLSDAERENIVLRRRVAELERELAEYRDLEADDLDSALVPRTTHELRTEIVQLEETLRMRVRELAAERVKSERAERELERVALGYVRAALACEEAQKVIANHECG